MYTAWQIARNCESSLKEAREILELILDAITRALERGTGRAGEPLSARSDVLTQLRRLRRGGGTPNHGELH